MGICRHARRPLIGRCGHCHARGDQLFFVTLADGAKGFVQQPDTEPSEAARIRRAEMSDLARQSDAGYIPYPVLP